MQLSVINFHSYVDLITNSSSELFVCDTNKSVNLIKSIIEKIIEDYYNSEDGKKYYPEGLKKKVWGDIFKEPKVCKVDFDLSKYPDQEDVKMATDYSYFDKENQLIYEEQNEKFPQPDCMKGKKWEQYNNNPKYKKWYKDKHAFYLEKVKPLWDKEAAAHERISKFFGLKDTAFINYRINLKKGAILLYSARDNSVPYEIWDKINKTLNAQNYHLG